MSEYFGTDPLARIAFLEAENAKLRDRVRELEEAQSLWWDFKKSKHISDVILRDGSWQHGDVDSWRPIGPLPGGE
jgi:hypothetical protein